MGTIIIEVDGNLSLKIRAKDLDEAIRKISELKERERFSTLKLKTKNFKFDREEAESR